MKKRRIFLWKSILYCFFFLSCGVLSSSAYLYSDEASSAHIFPETQVVFQRPSYVVSTDHSPHICDAQKEECKINFKLETLEWKNISTKYDCLWNTSLESEQFSRCNPNTVIFPEGEFHISLILTYKKTGEFHFAHMFEVHNPTILPPDKGGSRGVSEEESTSESSEEIPPTPFVKEGVERVINIQSWLDSGWTCSDERCKINLEYKKRSKEYCIWEFDGIEHLEKYTTTCNPGFIYVYPWMYDVSVRIYHEEDWFLEQLSLQVRNRYVVPEISQSREEIPPQSEEQNPPQSPLVMGEEAASESSEEIPPTPFVKGGVEQFEWIQIYGALINPKGKDVESEYIELVNISDHTINLKWLFIDDLVWKWSKQYQIETDIFLWPDEQHRFMKTLTSISLWNTLDEVNIWIGDDLLDTLSWDFQIPDDYVLKPWDTDAITRSAYVIRVVDGDTIQVRFDDDSIHKVRLIGVDTPETKHPEKLLEKYGIEAAKFTQTSLEWKQITVKQSLSNYQDKYGRLLGYVYLDELFFNAELITQWFARVYTRYDFPYQAEFIKLQKQAKKDKIWIWQEADLQKIIKKIEKQEKQYIIEEEVFTPEEQIDEIITENAPEQDSFLLLDTDQIDLKVEKNNGHLEVKKPKKYIFQKTLSYQKKSFKISGKTEPNFTVIVKWWDHTYHIIADDTGKYSKKITDISPGYYDMNFYLMPPGWTEQYIKSSLVEWTQDYIDQMNSYSASSPQKTSSKSSKNTWQIQKTSKIDTEIIALEESDIIDEPPKTPLWVVLGYILFGLSCMGWVHVLVMRV